MVSQQQQQHMPDYVMTLITKATEHTGEFHNHTSSTGYHSTASVQATAPQVICYDDISDSIKHKLDVVGVCSAGHMGVDLFFG